MWLNKSVETTAGKRRGADRLQRLRERDRNKMTQNYVDIRAFRPRPASRLSDCSTVFPADITSPEREREREREREA